MGLQPRTGIAVLALFLFSAVVLAWLIPKIVQIFETAGNEIERLICNWRNHRRRCKNDRRRRRQRLRNALAPLGRHIPAALFYCLCVLLVSVCAPILYIAFDQALRSWLRAPFSLVTAVMLIAAVTGFTTALAVSTTRGGRIKFAERMLDALAGKITTDHGVDADIIPFHPEPKLHHSATAATYPDIHQGSQNAPEWMISLRQLLNTMGGKYTIESLVAQINELERWHRRQLDKLARCHPCRKPPAIDWVCIVSNQGRFCALQSYEVFRHQIVDRRNAGYLTLLNQTDEKALWTAIAENIKNSKAQIAPGQAVQYPDAIPGLECFWIEQGTSREAGLRQMIENRKVQAMLVRNRYQGEPLGTISLTTLTDQVIFQALAEEHLATPDPEGICGQTPPGLPE